MPTSEVASRPVKVMSCENTKLNAPTAEVDCNPVKGTPIAGTKVPTEDVACTPVKICVIPIDKDPVDEVACNPVKPTSNASRTIPPTVDVAL